MSIKILSTLVRRSSCAGTPSTISDLRGTAPRLFSRCTPWNSDESDTKVNKIQKSQENKISDDPYRRFFAHHKTKEAHKEKLRETENQENKPKADPFARFFASHGKSEAPKEKLPEADKRINQSEEIGCTKPVDLSVDKVSVKKIQKSQENKTSTDPFARFFASAGKSEAPKEKLGEADKRIDQSEEFTRTKPVDLSVDKVASAGKSEAPKEKLGGVDKRIEQSEELTRTKPVDLPVDKVLVNQIQKSQENETRPKKSTFTYVDSEAYRKDLQEAAELINQLEEERCDELKELSWLVDSNATKGLEAKINALNAITQKLVSAKKNLERLRNLPDLCKSEVTGTEEKPTKSESETEKSQSDIKSDAKESNGEVSEKSDRDSVYSSDGYTTDRYESDYSDWEYSDKEETDSEKSDVKEMPEPVNPALVNPVPKKVETHNISPKEDLVNQIQKSQENETRSKKSPFARFISKHYLNSEAYWKALREAEERVNQLEKERGCAAEEYLKQVDECRAELKKLSWFKKIRNSIRLDMKKNALDDLTQKLDSERQNLKELRNLPNLYKYNGKSEVTGTEEKPTKSESETEKSLTEPEPEEIDHKKSDAKESNGEVTEKSDRETHNTLPKEDLVGQENETGPKRSRYARFIYGNYVHTEAYRKELQEAEEQVNQLEEKRHTELMQLSMANRNSLKYVTQDLVSAQKNLERLRNLPDLCKSEVTGTEEKPTKSESETEKSLSDTKSEAKESNGEVSEKSDRDSVYSSDGDTTDWDSDYSDWEYSDKEELDSETSDVKEMPAILKPAPVNPLPKKVETHNILPKEDLVNQIEKSQENETLPKGSLLERYFCKYVNSESFRKVLRKGEERVNQLEEECRAAEEEYLKLVDEEYRAELKKLSWFKKICSSIHLRSKLNALDAFTEKLDSERQNLEELRHLSNLYKYNSKSEVKGTEEKPTKSESETEKSLSEPELEEMDHKKSDAKEYSDEVSEKSDRDSVYSSDEYTTDRYDSDYSDWEYSDKEETDSEKSDVKETPEPVNPEPVNPAPVNPVPEKMETHYVLPKEDLMFFKKKLTWITYMVTSTAIVNQVWTFLMIYSQF